MILFGPFDQVLTMDKLPESGPIKDALLDPIKDAGILVKDGKIISTGLYKDLESKASKKVGFKGKVTAIPSFIDAHTHTCFAGTRVADYQKKLQGLSYEAIAKSGGGIFQTVQATRKATQKELLKGLLERLSMKLRSGVATIEIKSGYGLDLKTEIKMLETIEEAKSVQPLTLVSTLLAAHTLPPEFASKKEYLDWIIKKLAPKVKSLTKRVDIFCDVCAFSPEESKPFLLSMKKLGFTPVVHADQFSTGGSELAANVGALSADHLEVSSNKEITQLKKAKTIPIVLPGASLGLGLPFAKARLMLDLGLPLVIASDWNPGSAPSGDLLMQAAVLAIYEKLSIAETLAAITYRASAALGLKDRGLLKKGLRADFSIFPTSDFREILYWQGTMKPTHAVIQGAVYSFDG